MPEKITVPIDHATEKVFRNAEELRNWLQKEQKAWEWLWEAERGDGSIPPNNFLPVRDAYTNGAALAAHGASERLDNWIASAFRNRGVLATQSEGGRAALAAKERAGIEEARTVFQANWRSLDHTQLRTIVDLRGALLAAEPALLESADFGRELKAERTKYRAAITRLETRVAELEDQQRSDAARRFSQFRRGVALLRRLTERKAEKVSQEFATKTATALGSIAETEDQYRTQMGLKAPVQYWKDKATDHETAEKEYRKSTFWFFVVSALVIAAAAYIAGLIVLSVEDVDDRAPVYLLVAGALLGITSLIFWAGRLTVKLWLSEHHLRKDATERSIMTETYLALQESEQATESDRAIVLAAIFRPTPDGVVKEEGPADLGVQAAISKFLSKP